VNVGDLEHVAVTVLFHTIQQLSKATVSNSLKPNQQNCNLGSLIFGNTCYMYGIRGRSQDHGH